MRFCLVGLFVALLGASCGDGPRCGDCDCVSEPPEGGCVTNAQCREPTAVCDLAHGRCVECLVLADCGHQPGTVCSAGACVCPGGETWCAADVCVDTLRSVDHCGRCGHACFGACSGGVCVDPWEPVAVGGAPATRGQHVAVWTGSVMVVWGGALSANPLDVTATGGIYDPATFRWAPTNIVGAPTARHSAKAVWTGTRMLVWGGVSATTAPTDGGIFDPVANSWQPMSTVGAPEGRFSHAAVWTGDRMLVYGGFGLAVQQLANGGVYDPIADSWTAMTPTPESRAAHSAVWDPTGRRMLIYGGVGDFAPDVDVNFPTANVPGGRAYDPLLDEWSPLPTVGQPAARRNHTAVWAGNAMVVFGGVGAGNALGNGARWDGLAWTTLGVPGPAARSEHTAAWVAEAGVMVVWGGAGDTALLDTGGSWAATGDTWQAMPAVLSARSRHTAVSTGSSMIVWGGLGGAGAMLGDGGVFRP